MGISFLMIISPVRIFLKHSLAVFSFWRGLIQQLHQRLFCLAHHQNVCSASHMLPKWHFHWKSSVSCVFPRRHYQGGLASHGSLHLTREHGNDIVKNPNSPLLLIFPHFCPVRSCFCNFIYQLLAPSFDPPFPSPFLPGWFLPCSSRLSSYVTVSIHSTLQSNIIGTSTMCQILC